VKSKSLEVTTQAAVLPIARRRMSLDSSPISLLVRERLFACSMRVTRCETRVRSRGVCVVLCVSSSVPDIVGRWTGRRCVVSGSLRSMLCAGRIMLGAGAVPTGRLLFQTFTVVETARV
jgi:hypothetical protein